MHVGPERALATPVRSSRRVVGAVLLICAVLIAAAPAPGHAECWVSDYVALKPSVWNGKSVALTSRPAAPFAVSTRAMRFHQATVFALLHSVGAVDPNGDGREIAASNGLEDGAGYVGRTLLADLAARYGAVAAPMPAIATTDSYSASIARAAGGADLVLDIRPGLAAIYEHVTKAEQYRVTFETMVAVIDVRSHQRLAYGSCHGQGAELSPKGELLAGNAELLKRRLRAQWDECVTALETKMFGFEPAAAQPVPAEAGATVPQR